MSSRFYPKNKLYFTLKCNRVKFTDTLIMLVLPVFDSDYFPNKYD